ncbi:hypothetical protein QZH41_017241, partial [Actinostola sp. cb2023]
MILTKVFILMVLPLIVARGSPLHESSENKKTLQMLHQREHESNVDKQAPRHPFSSQRSDMVERRRKLEALLQRNPGLRTLLKSVLEKRKAQDVRMLQSDSCRPGLFYCDDRDSSLNDDVGAKRAALKKVMHMRKFDAGSYCPPGFFYCPSDDSSGAQADRDIKQYQRDRLELLDKMFPKKVQQDQYRSQEMQDLERIIQLANDRKESFMPKRTEARRHNVQFVRVPATVKKVEESDEGTKAKSTHGEKLADDLMSSLQV